MSDIFSMMEKPSACQWCAGKHTGTCKPMIGEACKRSLADPDIDLISRVMLFNLTTKPKVAYGGLMLMWMQVDPSKWEGMSPEQSAEVGRTLTGE